MTDNSQAQIRRVMPSEARLYRDIRLEALQRSPEAFGSTFEHEHSQSLGHFEDVLATSAVFGAFGETDLVGMAGYRTQAGAKQSHKGLLWGMYVRPSARGSGVAKRLVDAVVRHARERVELLQLTVVSDNETAQRLYRHFGFVPYGHEIHALKQNGRYYDEVLMALALNHSSSRAAT
jgi:ribosomal protein S18 acetylase RimI-like enzyme